MQSESRALLSKVWAPFSQHKGAIVWPSLQRASLVAQMVKNLPAKLKTWVRSLGRKDPLEQGMTTHPSILA